MNSILSVFVLFIVITLKLSAQESADKIIGVWSNEDSTVQNEIYKKGDTYEARIVKGKAFVGKVTLYSMKFDGKTWNGKAYQANTGRTADAILNLNGNDTLIITAYLAGYTRIRKWYRIKQ